MDHSCPFYVNMPEYKKEKMIMIEKGDEAK
ncbi:hypothetical protein HNQ35_001817 [Cerasibacillus quisquiliarum]|nr:hypothetical protein [Cerasibacillus quisquiliarum]